MEAAEGEGCVRVERAAVAGCVLAEGADAAACAAVVADVVVGWEEGAGEAAGAQHRTRLR